MSRFFIGQRVRVARLLDHNPAPYDLRAVGLEGVVNALNCRNYGGWGMVGVTLPMPNILGDNTGWAFRPDELEPILPEGHRAGDYSFSELLDRCQQGEGVPA